MMTNRSTMWKHVVSEKPCDNSLDDIRRCTASVVQKKRGLTLLEVVVGLVLMGSLLVSSLLAFSRHRRQLRLADKRIEATMIADDIVNGLLNQKDGIPVNSRGAVAGHPNWYWQTSLVGVTQIASIDLQVIRFEIFELGESTVRLVSVELAKKVAAIASAKNEHFFEGELFSGIQCRLQRRRLSRQISEKSADTRPSRFCLVSPVFSENRARGDRDHALKQFTIPANCGSMRWTGGAIHEIDGVVV